jgi:hypothetical protein
VMLARVATRDEMNELVLVVKKIMRFMI